MCQKSPGSLRPATFFCLTITKQVRQVLYSSLLGSCKHQEELNVWEFIPALFGDKRVPLTARIGKVNPACNKETNQMLPGSLHTHVWYPTSFEELPCLHVFIVENGSTRWMYQNFISTHNWYVGLVVVSVAAETCASILRGSRIATLENIFCLISAEYCIESPLILLWKPERASPSCDIRHC